MDIIIAIHNVWTDKIFAGTKPFEFRTKLPAKFQVGDKIYFYETKVRGGAAAVVGECTVDQILPLLSPQGKWPICMTYHFIDYYMEHIAKNPEKAEVYRKCKERFADKQTCLRFGAITNYALSEYYMSCLESTGELPDLFEDAYLSGDVSWYNDIGKQQDECHKDHLACDTWLESMGMYNEYGETCYRFAFHMANIKKYEQPIPLSAFTCKTGEPVKSLQSFCYCTSIAKR